MNKYITRRLEDIPEELIDIKNTTDNSYLLSVKANPLVFINRREIQSIVERETIINGEAIYLEIIVTQKNGNYIIIHKSLVRDKHHQVWELRSISI